MKYSDIVGLPKVELRRKKLELRKEMFQSRMKNALGQLSNPMSIRALRRDVARLETALQNKM